MKLRLLKPLTQTTATESDPVFPHSRKWLFQASLNLFFAGKFGNQDHFQKKIKNQPRRLLFSFHVKFQRTPSFFFQPERVWASVSEVLLETGLKSLYTPTGHTASPKVGPNP